ncbi:hypothetical protein P43SY_006687 [Pythium insidiosum]|uniref:Uncharacterized protein n=1 Tax=Pythium insidiosum TaxID=114742 RepID=A0AAD5M2D6_PYTIN|nr:hypothetical protein P43SY_006687 [Pythium insidiosum]
MLVSSKWDASQIPDLQHKLAVITGANSGIGFEAALELARHGAHVVLACRNEARGRAAVDKIRETLQQDKQETASVRHGAVEFMQLDVSDLSSVQRFTQAFRESHDRLDLLINNAGIMAVGYATTVDGFESQLATNHLGHFALTAQLFDLLCKSAPSRIVNVSSMAHRSALKFDEDAIMTPREKYDPWSVYADSKLANLLFTAELSRRLEANGIEGVQAVACHPGMTATNLMAAPSENNSWFYRMMWKVSSVLPIYQSAAMGALPTLYAATANETRNGGFYGPDGFFAVCGYPTLEEPSKQAQSLSAAHKLWELSERLTKTPFPVQK